MPIWFQGLNTALNMHQPVRKKRKIRPGSKPYESGDRKQYVRAAPAAQGYMGIIYE